MAEQLFKKRKEARAERKSKQKKLLSETWLFVCEGSKTEPNYIKSLIDHANTITTTALLKKTIVGEGRNTTSLVKSVDDLLGEIEGFNIKRDIPYGKVFVIFDKDSFKEDNFDNAIKMAVSRKYIPIWSNECFELWYLFHYNCVPSDTGSKSYFKKLGEYLGVRNYEDEKSMDVFPQIHTPEKIKVALQHAERLDKEFRDEIPPSKRVPCTQMFKLIRELEQYLKIKL